MPPWLRQREDPAERSSRSSGLPRPAPRLRRPADGNAGRLCRGRGPPLCCTRYPVNTSIRPSSMRTGRDTLKSRQGSHNIRLVPASNPSRGGGDIEVAFYVILGAAFFACRSHFFSSCSWLSGKPWIVASVSVLMMWAYVTGFYTPMRPRFNKDLSRTQAQESIQPAAFGQCSDRGGLFGSNGICYVPPPSPAGDLRCRRHLTWTGNRETSNRPLASSDPLRSRVSRGLDWERRHQ